MCYSFSTQRLPMKKKPIGIRNTKNTKKKAEVRWVILKWEGSFGRQINPKQVTIRTFVQFLDMAVKRLYAYKFNNKYY